MLRLHGMQNLGLKRRRNKRTISFIVLILLFLLHLLYDYIWKTLHRFLNKQSLYINLFREIGMATLASGTLPAPIAGIYSCIARNVAYSSSCTPP